MREEREGQFFCCLVCFCFKNGLPRIAKDDSENNADDDTVHYKAFQRREKASEGLDKQRSEKHTENLGHFPFLFV